MENGRCIPWVGSQQVSQTDQPTGFSRLCVRMIIVRQIQLVKQRSSTSRLYIIMNVFSRPQGLHMISQAKLLKIFKLSTGIIIYAEAIIKIYQFHLHYQKKCDFCLISHPTQLHNYLLFSICLLLHNSKTLESASNEQNVKGGFINLFFVTFVDSPSSSLLNIRYRPRLVVPESVVPRPTCISVPLDALSK